MKGKWKLKEQGSGGNKKEMESRAQAMNKFRRWQSLLIFPK